MIKFFFLFLPLILLSASDHTVSSFSVNEAEKPGRPNILFIVVDDLKPLLGIYGEEHIQSPNIDRLGKMGVTFTHAYCQQAVCAPSRVSVFTGMRPDRTRVWDLKTDMRDENPDVVTLPGFLKANGYETAGFGKLIHGAKNNDPDSWSIPYVEEGELKYADGFSYPANGMYQDERIRSAMEIAKKQGMNWRATNEYLKEQNLRPSTEALNVPDNAYEDGAIAEAGIKMIERLAAEDKPFFLALGFHKPHLPFVAPKKYWEMYDRSEIDLSPFQIRAENSPSFAYHNGMELRNYSDISSSGPIEKDKQQELIHGYRACVSYVDSQIGKVLDKLEQLDLTENTIIILWGDHGWHLGDHGLWCKHTNFEQATRAPLIISSPGMGKGSISNNITEFVDIFPTICELVQLDPPALLEGESLAPVLKDPGLKIEDYAVSQYPRGDELMGYSMRSEHYRLTLWFSGKFRDGKTAGEDNIEAVEFYNYQSDPMETKSLANVPEYSELIREMTLELLSRL